MAPWSRCIGTTALRCRASQRTPRVGAMIPLRTLTGWCIAASDLTGTSFLWKMGVRSVNQLLILHDSGGEQVSGNQRSYFY